MQAEKNLAIQVFQRDAEYMKNVLETERNTSKANMQAAQTRVGSAERFKDQAIKDRTEPKDKDSQFIEGLRTQLRSTEQIAQSQGQQMQSAHTITYGQAVSNAELLMMQKEAAIKQKYEN